jgi:hypothetical protein
MTFQNLVVASKEYFPKLQIKYKNQSWLMKLMGKALFFDPKFMTQYSTTICDTVYFPSEKFTKAHPVSSSVVLLHELVHINDQKKVGKIFFLFSYLLPQILVPICLLLLLVLSWKIVLPLALLFCAPIPAFFRMYWEKSAYLSSFYVLQLLGNKLHFDPHLKAQEDIFLKHFHNSSYYYMWPFHDINKQFDKAMKLAIE